MSRQDRQFRRQRATFPVPGWHDACVVRRLVPIRTVECSGCGRSSAFIPDEGLLWPTADRVGTVTRLMSGCACGRTDQVQVLVEAV